MKLTRAKQEMLELAIRSPTGNPWHLVGVQARAGGGKWRMFEQMRAAGYFDDWNRITPAGRLALQEKNNG